MAEPVAKEDVYIDNKGNFVKGDDKDVAIQVAHKGVVIPKKVRDRHGLSAEGEPDGKRSKYFAKFNLDLANPADSVQAAEDSAKPKAPDVPADDSDKEIGRASCRDRE